MATRDYLARILVVVIGAGLLSSALTKNAFAHCDTLDGPVVQTARSAIAKGDVTALLKWVQPENEEEIRAAFEKTLAVRTSSAQAEELADMYFFETLVRIHRAGEGAPYTGLKSGDTVDPAVVLADRALESESVDKLVDVLSKAMAKGIRKRFQHASKNQTRADNSVAEGREFVESYVLFTHYVEGLHAVISGSGGAHGESGEKSHDGHGQ